MATSLQKYSSLYRKAVCFTERKLGQDEVVFMIAMHSMDNHNVSLAQRNSEEPYVIIQKILLPGKPKKKKDSENEKEYEPNERRITVNRIAPWQTAGPYSDKTWNTLVTRWFPTKWNKVITYDGVFRVDVFEKEGLGIAYIFKNEYDQKIEWYKIGINEIPLQNN